MVSRLITVFAACVFAVGECRARAEHPFSLSLSLSCERLHDYEPLYFAVRLKNETQENAELRGTEIFSFELGDVGIHQRPSADRPWQRIELYWISAGVSSPFRLKPKVIAPGEILEVVECVIPATFAKIERATPWELHGGFSRSDRTWIATSTSRIHLRPAEEQGEVMLQAAIVLFAKGPEHVMDEAETEAVKAAAARSPAIARIAELFQRFEGLRKFDSTRDQKPAIKELAALVEKLPPIEREYWARKFAKIHHLAAGPLLKPNPTHATFHLDVCAALDKALGTTSEKANGIRNSCVEYRKWAARYAERKKTR